MIKFKAVCITGTAILAATGLFTTKAVAEVGLISQAGGTLGPFSAGPTGIGTAGWSFHLNTEVILTELGVYDDDQDGFDNPHEVGIWTATGTLIADGFLSSGNAAPLLGNFRYIDVPNVVLPVGDYVIGATNGIDGDSGGSDFINQDATLTTDPFVEYMQRGGAGPGLVFPTPIAGPGGGNFMTSNFQFTVVPEPCSLLLALVAGIGLSMRSRAC